MKINEAAEQLWKEAKDRPWFQSIGLNSPEDTKIYLYLRQRKLPRELRTMTHYEDYPLVIQYMGEVVPL